MSVFVERKQLLDDIQNNTMLGVRINMGHLNKILVQHIFFQLFILRSKNAQISFLCGLILVLYYI